MVGRLLWWLLRIAAASTIALVLAIGAVLLINLGDAELDPEAAAFLKFEHPELADEQNAFFHAIGLGAPPGEDPHTAGRRWMAAVTEAQARMLMGQKESWPAAPRGFPRLPELCAPEACIEAAQKSTAELEKVLAEHAARIERYRALHRYPGYAEATDARLVSYPILPVLPLIGSQRLFLLAVAAQLVRGEADAALGALRDDIAFGRRMLAGSRTIVHKMLAGAQLVRALMLAADAMRAAGRAGPLADVLAPLTAAERRLGDALRAELLLAASALDPARAGTPAWGLHGGALEQLVTRPLFQHKATVNALYSGYFAPWAAVDAAPATQFDAGVARARAAEPDPAGWGAIYNPIGKLLVIPNATPGMEQYIARMHDLDALVRLVGLQAAIVEQGVSAEGVEGFAAASKRVDPYTGKAFRWDGEARQLWFMPRSRYVARLAIGGSEKRVAVGFKGGS